jgi:hypothetical protein
LVAGPLRALFDGGDLRYLRVGDEEVVRRIYVGVRDGRWGTVKPRVTDVRAEQAGPDWFEVSFAAEHVRDEVNFAWRGRIEARAERAAGGEAVVVTYEMDGFARRAFETNRTGVCVLHPLDLTGTPCMIEHSDGTRDEARFPLEIDPNPPFTNIRAIDQGVAGATARIEFEGEVFETEDQRNWGDGSYKTYCRPLANGFPYWLGAGERVRHRVVVRVGIGGTGVRRERPAWLGLNGAEMGPLPGIGTRWQGRALLGERQAERARELRLAHLRVEARLSGEWKAELAAAADAARRLELPLEVAAHVAGDVEGAMRMLADEVARLGVPVCRWIVYEDGRPMASERAVAVAKSVLERVSPAVPVGGGTVGNFTELNRDRPAAGAIDLVAYPYNPQVHATDDLSIVENLQAIEWAVITVGRFLGPGSTAKLAIGPVLLHRRPDPFAKGKSGQEAEAERADPRQRSAFGAAWTVAVLKHYAELQVGSVSLFDLLGPAGVMDEEGEAYPLYRVFAEVAAFAPEQVLLCLQAEPLRHVGLALRRKDRACLIAASLHWEETQVEIRTPYRVAGCVSVVAGLDGREGDLSTDGGMSELRLPPYAVVRVDLVDAGEEGGR